MSVEDRIKTAAYTGPDGTRIEFEWEDLQKTISKKTKAHEFPDADYSFIRDSGVKGRTYPMKIFLTGRDHDILADRFENLLVQRGPGLLEHPLYGPKLVMPFADIQRYDKLKTEGNQTSFDVTFKETIADPHADENEDTSATVAVAIASGAFAAQFAASVDLGTPGERANFVSGMKALLAGLGDGLKSAQDGTASLQNGMDRINKSISNGLDAGILAPLTMAQQLKTLAGAPARSLASLKGRLAAYKNLAASIFSGSGTGTGGGTGSSENGLGIIQAGVVTPGVDSTEANLFHGNSFIAQTMVLGVAAAVADPVEGQAYKSRNDVVEQIDELQEIFDDFIAWSDANFVALADASPVVDPFEPIASGQGSTDTGEAIDALALVVSTTIRHLTATAFVLPPQRAFTLESPCTPLELTARLYGELGHLDDFIEANNLTGDEILLLPIGKTVVYYLAAA